MTTYGYFVLLGLIQLAHSQEEIWTSFHKRWFVFTMSQTMFVTFEIVFSALIVAYMIRPNLPAAHVVMSSFALIMLINGIGHTVWSLVTKKYQPGLVTAPLFVVIFAFYYISIVSIGGM